MGYKEMSTETPAAAPDIKARHAVISSWEVEEVEAEDLFLLKFNVFSLSISKAIVTWDYYNLYVDCFDD